MHYRGMARPERAPAAPSAQRRRDRAWRTRGMKRSATVALVMILAAVAAVVTAWLPQQDPNEFFALYPLELLGVLIAGLVALSHLFTHPWCAPGLLGAGVYTLAM